MDISTSCNGCSSCFWFGALTGATVMLLVSLAIAWGVYRLIIQPQLATANISFEITKTSSTLRANSTTATSCLPEGTKSQTSAPSVAPTHMMTDPTCTRVHTIDTMVSDGVAATAATNLPPPTCTVTETDQNLVPQTFLSPVGAQTSDLSLAWGLEVVNANKPCPPSPHNMDAVHASQQPKFSLQDSNCVTPRAQTSVHNKENSSTNLASLLSPTCVVLPNVDNEEHMFVEIETTPCNQLSLNDILAPSNNIYLTPMHTQTRTHSNNNLDNTNNIHSHGRSKSGLSNLQMYRSNSARTLQTRSPNNISVHLHNSASNISNEMRQLRDRMQMSASAGSNLRLQSPASQTQSIVTETSASPNARESAMLESVFRDFVASSQSSQMSSAGSEGLEEPDPDPNTDAVVILDEDRMVDNRMATARSGIDGQSAIVDYNDINLYLDDNQGGIIDLGLPTMKSLSNANAMVGCDSESIF